MSKHYDISSYFSTIRSIISALLCLTYSAEWTVMSAFTSNLITTNRILHNAAVVEFHEKQTSLSADAGQQIIWVWSLCLPSQYPHRLRKREKEEIQNGCCYAAVTPTHLHVPPHSFYSTIISIFSKIYGYEHYKTQHAAVFPFLWQTHSLVLAIATPGPQAMEHRLYN